MGHQGELVRETARGDERGRNVTKLLDGPLSRATAEALAARAEQEVDERVQRALLLRLVDAGLVSLVVDRLANLPRGVTLSTLQVMVERDVKLSWPALAALTTPRDAALDRAVLTLLAAPSQAELGFLVDRTLRFLRGRDGPLWQQDPATVEAGRRAFKALVDKGTCQEHPPPAPELRERLACVLSVLRSDERALRDRGGEDAWSEAELRTVVWQCVAVERLLGE